MATAAVSPCCAGPVPFHPIPRFRARGSEAVRRRHLGCDRAGHWNQRGASDAQCRSATRARGRMEELAIAIPDRSAGRHVPDRDFQPERISRRWLHRQTRWRYARRDRTARGALPADDVREERGQAQVLRRGVRPRAGSGVVASDSERESWTIVRWRRSHDVAFVAFARNPPGLATDTSGARRLAVFATFAM